MQLFDLSRRCDLRRADGVQTRFGELTYGLAPSRHRTLRPKDSVASRGYVWRANVPWFPAYGGTGISWGDVGPTGAHPVYGLRGTASVTSNPTRMFLRWGWPAPGRWAKLIIPTFLEAFVTLRPVGCFTILVMLRAVSAQGPN